jgi:hypothetical protein
MTNSAKNHLETLTKVPRLQDGLLPPDSAEYPRNVASLLGVSGNETVPGTDIRCEWNRTKSLNLIRFYDTG